MRHQDLALSITRFIVEQRRLEAILNEKEHVFIVDKAGLSQIKVFVKGCIREMKIPDNSKTSLYIDIMLTVKGADYLGDTFNELEQKLIKVIRQNQIESRLH
jgi:hypothetical protein